MPSDLTIASAEDFEFRVHKAVLDEALSFTTLWQKSVRIEARAEGRLFKLAESTDVDYTVSRAGLSTDSCTGSNSDS